MNTKKTAKLIDKEKIALIRASHLAPRIAIIGAKDTTREVKYNQPIGRAVGYAVRDFIGSGSGNIFTGGRGAVGTDTYFGVVSWCLDQHDERRYDDRFAVVIPEIKEGTKNPPRPHREYSNARNFIVRDGDVPIIYAGENYEQRRWYLSRISDVIVSVNGSEGTLEEALSGLHEEDPIPLVTFSGTGKVSELLARLKGAKRKNYGDLLSEYGCDPDRFKYLLEHVNTRSIHVISGKLSRKKIITQLKKTLDKVLS